MQQKNRIRHLAIGEGATTEHAKQRRGAAQGPATAKHGRWAILMASDRSRAGGAGPLDWKTQPSKAHKGKTGVQWPQTRLQSKQKIRRTNRKSTGPDASPVRGSGRQAGIYDGATRLRKSRQGLRDPGAERKVYRHAMYMYRLALSDCDGARDWKGRRRMVVGWIHPAAAFWHSMTPAFNRCPEAVSRPGLTAQGSTEVRTPVGVGRDVVHPGEPERDPRDQPLGLPLLSRP